MIDLRISRIHAGWATVTIGDGAEPATFSASYLSDGIRDLVDSVASLRATASAHCCWPQEPGQIDWQLQRSGAEVEVTIIRFTGAVRHGSHNLNGDTVFKASTSWNQFARQVLETMNALRTTMGTERYEQEWGYEFPREACDKLQQAVTLEGR